MKAIRLQRFKAFEDSGWIEFKPLTLLFGYNSAGKSSILQALLMLKQSLQNPATEVPFVFSSDKGVDLGAFEDVIYQHRIDHRKPMIISLRIEMPEYEHLLQQNHEISGKNNIDKNQVSSSSKKDLLEYSVEISYNQKQRFIDVVGFSINEANKKVILNMKKDAPGENAKAVYYSDYYDVANRKIPVVWYNFLPHVKSDEQLESLTKITELLLEKVRNVIEKVVNIGPVRDKPQRTMLFTGEKPASVGIGGEDTFKLLYSDRYSNKSRNLDKKINKWLCNYGYKFEWKMVKSNLGQFVLNELETDKKNGIANIVDVGFGISQVLPIAVQLYVMDENGILLIEQPEIHLHAKAQADLADLFIDAVIDGNKCILIETHSENLLLRLRRRIAENKIKSNEVGIYYISRQNGTSKVTPMDLNEYGDIEKMPEDFKNFFLDDFNDIMLLHSAKGHKLGYENNG